MDMVPATTTIPRVNVPNAVEAKAVKGSYGPWLLLQTYGKWGVFVRAGACGQACGRVDVRSSVHLSVRACVRVLVLVLVLVHVCVSVRE